VTLVVSGIVLVAIVGAVFLLYRGGVRHKGEGPAEVGAPIAQMKTPAQPDQNAAPAQLSVNRVEASEMPGNATPAFAPPPEQPLPRPAPMPAPPVATTTLPRPAAVSPETAAPLAPAHPPTSAATPTPAHPTTVAALPPPAAPAAKPAKPMTIASLTDAALKPPVKPAPRPPALAPPPAPVVATAAPTGAAWVQIGAYSSSPLAEQGWRDVAKLAPSSMAGKGQRVEPVAKDGKTLYRAYITGFASRDAAQAFCGKLKAAGRACFVK
jgi:hypothetical protein